MFSLSEYSSVNKYLKGKAKITPLAWDSIGSEVEELWDENCVLWEALSELSALVEFLVEKQEKTAAPAKKAVKAPVASAKRTRSDLPKRA